MTAPIAASHDATDVSLIDAAEKGDLIAWERLVRRYQEPVYRVAYLIVRASDLAEEATRSAFIRAYRSLPSFDPEASVMPWLFRIVAGEARQHRRESGRPSPSSRPHERSNGPQLAASPIPGLEKARSLTPAERDAVVGAFERLGEQDRLTLASRYHFGLSKADAAAAMSTSSALVDEHLASALKNLRKRMATQS